MINIIMEIDFITMVDEAYTILDKKSLAEPLILPALDIKIETIRLHWKNVKEFLKVIGRNPEHFINFLRHEMPGKEINWFSASKSDGLIIHGQRQKQAIVSDLALKYVDNYVICPSCKRGETNMLKINSKKYRFECLDCGFEKFIL